MSHGLLRILLVESDPGDARLVREYAGEAAESSIELVIAKTLAEARKVASDSGWDVILLDLGLPDSDGIDTFRTVQQTAPGIPIVVLTGAESIDSALEAIHEGAQDYLPKNLLTPELLSRTIRYAIERARTRSELKEERQRLFSVLDSLPMFVYLQAPDLTIPFANKTFHELFGETEGRSCYEIFHGYDGPCPECPPIRVQETGIPEISEWMSPEGRTYAIYDQVFPGASDTTLTLEVGLDITEQRQAQQELARSEARFRRLAENAPDIIYRYRVAPTPGFDYISPAVTEVSGYTPEEYYADPLLELKIVHPDDRHLIEGLLGGRLTSKRTHDVRWIHKGGHIRWVEDHHTPVFGESGKLIAIEGVARDITEWKRAQQALADSEARYRLLFEHAGIGIGYYTPDGTLIGYNRVAAAHLGGTPEDFAGKTILELFGEEKGPEYLQRVRDTVRTGRTVTFEDFAALPTGPKWFLSTYSRVEGNDGEIVGVQIFSEEITERKVAEAARAEEEKRLFEVLSTLPSFVYLQAADHSIPFANRRFVELFGDPRTRPCHEILLSCDTPCEECRTLPVLESGKTIRRDWITEDGLTYELHEQLFPVADGEDMVLVIGTDVTERRRAAEALQTADEIVSALPMGMLIYQFREPDQLWLISGSPAAEPFVDLEKHVESELGFHWPAPMVARLRTPLVAVAREGGMYDKEVSIGAPELRHAFHMRAFRIPGDRVVIAFEDISERRMAEASVIEWKNRYEGAIEASRHILYDWDSRTDEVTYGGDVKRILGYTEGEMVGGLQHWLDLIHPEDRENFGEAIDRLRETHEPAHLQYRVRRKDGEYIDVEDDGNFIVSPDGETVRMLGFVKDVTERRRASERIEESERRYRGMVELSPVGIVTVDLKGVVTSCNFAFEEMTGYAAGELVGKHFAKLPPAKLGDIAQYLQIFRGILAGRTQAPFETSWTRKDGTQREGEVRVSLMKREGKLFGMQVIIQDISERRKTMEALKESELRYRSLFEDAALGIYQTTPDGRILAANPALVRLLGYDSFEELAKRNLEEEGYEPETPRADFKELIEQVGSFTGRESAWKRRDGRTIHVRENARVVRNEVGEILYYEGTIEDITEQKTAEREAEALRAQLELTQFSIDSTDAVVLWVRPDGHLTYVNEAACRMLGYSREELLRMAVWEIDTEYPKARRTAAWSELKNQKSEVSESTFRTKDGRHFPVEITAQYLEFRGTELEFAVAFDISERKRLEAQLRQNQRLESIGTLASGVAHEINNPLTGIINYAQLISDRIEDEKLKGFADGIREEGDRVAKIVRNLLSFSRREIEHHSPARLADIVDASLSLYRALLRRNRIEVTVDVPEDLPKINCRSQEIQQVLINLITNARDSLNLRFPSGDKEKRIAIRAQVLEENERSWIRLTVEDRGRGIDPAVIGRVFDPFFTTKPRDQGTGLGLSISYGLVRDHDGRMSVESVPDSVTRFLVDLPIPSE